MKLIENVLSLKSYEQSSTNPFVFSAFDSENTRPTSGNL
jgi:hypothetical protein